MILASLLSVLRKPKTLKQRDDMVDTVQLGWGWAEEGLGTQPFSVPHMSLHTGDPLLSLALESRTLSST